MNDRELRFEEPPPKLRFGRDGSPFWAQAAGMCREHPGQWLNVGEWSSGTVSNISRGKLKALREGFEATARGIPDKHGRSVVYVRYVGSDSVEAAE